jgi:hypothetical protein
LYEVEGFKMAAKVGIEACITKNSQGIFLPYPEKKRPGFPAESACLPAGPAFFPDFRQQTADNPDLSGKIGV